MDEFPGGHAERPSEELPRELAADLEAIVRRMDSGAGVRELWLRLEDGHIRKWRLSHEGGRDALVRFDPPPLRLRG